MYLKYVNKFLKSSSCYTITSGFIKVSSDNIIEDISSEQKMHKFFLYK